MKFPVTITDRTITVLIDFVPHTVDRDNPHWNEIKAALSSADTTSDQLLSMIYPAASVQAATENVAEIELRSGRLFFRGQAVHNALSDRILQIINEGDFDVMPWVRFAEKVYANPQPWAQDELYLFLEQSDLGIVSNGNFIAYKNVDGQYRDIRTGTFDNSIGSVCEVPRHTVDTNRDNTCSTGLHFCSKEYLPLYVNHHNGHTMVVEINPADVVSIPSDYNNSKGRTWRYKVVGEIPHELAKTWVWPAVVDEDDLEVDLDDWDDFYDDIDDSYTIDVWQDAWDELDSDELDSDEPVEDTPELPPAEPPKKRFGWFRRK